MKKPRHIGGTVHAQVRQPEFGEIWWLTLEPRVGQELKKRRPCLVLSNNKFNSLARLVGVAPISSTPGLLPYRRFSIPLPSDLTFEDNKTVGGWVLPAQFKFIDWVGRDGKRVGRVPDTVTTRVTDMVTAILEPS